MKSPVKNYLTITKTEWNGLVVLVILITGVLAAPFVYEHFHKNTPTDFRRFNKTLAQLKAAGISGMADEESIAHKPYKLFKFNPNNLSIKQWQALGLSTRQIKGIKNYEAKGGRFYTKADVKKMYTLTPQDYKRLEPYIHISNIEAETIRPVKVVELNTADSAQLTQLRGIGKGFARRIIQYRTRLGGFYSKRQLNEIFGMDDMHYRDVQAQFTVNPRKVKKLNVNTVELDDLKNFPYLSYKQANALVQYRKQHGNYESLDEIRNIAIIDEAILYKIRPYLVIQ
ncbi:helix-hairpin-helix domain-containing protein [Mucilaginibacter terrae]|uniref:helix-hairpin-helix domain-containing protein n=1 Tax=Mucilaginibacter terrae TaxID=1955052 RepID=UPI0036327D30